MTIIVKCLYFVVLLSIFLLENSFFLPTDNNLVAHYPLNGNAKDLSGNNFHGNIVGKVKSVSDRFGNHKGALEFKGGCIKIAKPMPNELRPSKGFTLAAWVYVSSIDGHELGGIIASQYDKDHACYSMSIDYRYKKHGGNLGGVHFQVGTSKYQYTEGWWAGRNVGTTNIVLPRNKWVHVVTVAEISSETNIGQYKVYFNNALIARWPAKSSIGYSNNCLLTIGVNNHKNQNFRRIFNGRISDVRIYDRPLSEDEILKWTCFSISNDDKEVCSGKGVCSSPNNCTCMLGETYYYKGENCQYYVKKPIPWEIQDPYVENGRSTNGLDWLMGFLILIVMLIIACVLLFILFGANCFLRRKKNDLDEILK